MSLERITFELKQTISQPFLDVCALKGIDPDRMVERLMSDWLSEERKRMAEKEKAPKEMARVLRLVPRKKR